MWQEYNKQQIIIDILSSSRNAPGGATQIYRCTHACPWVLKIPPKQVSYFDEKNTP